MHLVSVKVLKLCYYQVIVRRESVKFGANLEHITNLAGVQILSINLHCLPISVLAKNLISLISEIRSYRENSISMIICVKRRHCEYGYYQNGIAEKLLLIDLSGTYGII